MSREVICPKARGERVLYRREATEDGRGSRLVSEGREEFFYSVEVETDLLGILAVRAAGNKGGEARDGALRVKVISRRRLTEPEEGGAR